MIYEEDLHISSDQQPIEFKGFVKNIIMMTTMIVCIAVQLGIMKLIILQYHALRCNAEHYVTLHRVKLQYITPHTHSSP